MDVQDAIIALIANLEFKVLLFVYNPDKNDYDKEYVAEKPTELYEYLRDNDIHYEVTGINIHTWETNRIVINCHRD